MFWDWGVGGGGDGNLRWLTVESDAYGFQFSLEQGSLLGLFGGVQHHEDEIACLGC